MPRPSHLALLGVCACLIAALAGCGIGGQGAEGNDTPGTATRLTSDGTVVQADLASPADVDYYVFTAQTGAQYVIETLDLAEANDTHLEVYGGDGVELLARNDDGDQEAGASRLAFIPLVSGDYLACVRAYWRESGAYSLRIAASPATTGPSCPTPLIVDGPVVRRSLTYPLIEDWFGFEASPGIRYFLETSDLTEGCDTTLTLYSAGLVALAYDDDSGEELCSLLSWMPDTAGQYYVKVAAYNSVSVGTFSVRLTTTPAMNAQTIVVDGPAVDGVLSEADERDHYCFEAEAGKTYRVYTLGLSSGCDTILRVADPDLLVIDINDDYGGGGNASAVTFTAVQSGPHIATVTSYQEAIGTYGVRVVLGAATGPDLLDTSGMATAVVVAAGDDPTPGVLSPAAESNWFRFRASPGVYYLIETLDLTAGSGSTECDTRLFLYRDGDQRPFRTSDDAYGLASLTGWVANYSGWAYARVTAYETRYGDYRLRVSSGPAAGGGIAPSAATLLEVDGPGRRGNLTPVMGRNWFRFPATAGQTYYVTTDGGGVDTWVILYDGAGTSLQQLAEDDDSGPGLGSRVDYEAEVSGDVYVLVRVAGASGYPSLGEYRIRVLSVDPGPTD